MNNLKFKISFEDYISYINKLIKELNKNIKTDLHINIYGLYGFGIIHSAIKYDVSKENGDNLSDINEKLSINECIFNVAIDNSISIYWLNNNFYNLIFKYDNLNLDEFSLYFNNSNANDENLISISLYANNMEKYLTNLVNEVINVNSSDDDNSDITYYSQLEKIATILKIYYENDVEEISIPKMQEIILPLLANQDIKKSLQSILDKIGD